MMAVLSFIASIPVEGEKSSMHRRRAFTENDLIRASRPFLSHQVQQLNDGPLGFVLPPILPFCQWRGWYGGMRRTPSGCAGFSAEWLLILFFRV